MMMKTRCPECETILTLTHEQLQQRNGMVRCGVCRQVFNAIEHLYEEDYPVLNKEGNTPPSETIASPVKQYIHKAPYKASPHAMPSSQHEPTVNVAISHQESERSFHNTEDVSHRITPLLPNTENMPDVSFDAREPNLYTNTSTRENSDRHYISYQKNSEQGNMMVSEEGYDDSYEEDDEQTGRHGVVWFVLVVFAVLILLGQLSYVFRNQISHIFPSTWPYLVQMCGVFGCEVGIKKSIDDLQLENVMLRGDNSLFIKPGEQGLRLQAILKNKGVHLVQWPSLLLSLKNQQGVVVNSKIISPKLYLLPELLVQSFQPDTQVPINIPFTIMSNEVKNYELNIFNP